MDCTTSENNRNNVIDLVTKHAWSTTQQQEAARQQATTTTSVSTGPQIVRIVAETDGLEVLYCNDEESDELYGLKILCWALRADGEIVAMIPWLEHVSACTELNSEQTGYFAGYYDPVTKDIFDTPPLHKCLELEMGAEFFAGRDTALRAQPTGDLSAPFKPVVLQEICDTLGTHAAIWHNEDQSIELNEVFSWQLLSNGKLQPMTVNEDRFTNSPVMPGDSCLDVIDGSEPYCYFFQHNVALKLKQEDPATIEALSNLVMPTQL